jgi:hypothetical protein
MWGPSARVCINLERGELSVAEYSSHVTAAAKQLAADPVAIMDLNLGLGFTEDAPHRLLTVRPANLTAEGRSTAKSNIPTRYLLGFVMRALAALDMVQQSQFFTLISSHPWLRGAAGWCFEKFVHVRLIAHPTSTPLVAIPAKQNSPTLPIPVCEKFHPLSRASLLKEANKYTLPFYWWPTSGQFTSLDAVICTEKEVLLLQTTIALGGHNIKLEGIDKVLDHLPKGFRSCRRLCLVFVTDDEQTAVRLRNQKLPGLSPYKLEIFSSVFMVGKTPLSKEERETLEKILVSNDCTCMFA